MDVAFPYKEAITNAYGLIDHTKTHVASQPLLYIPEEKAKGQSSILTVKQVFEAVHFDTPFNQIVEKAAEWK